MKQKFTPSGYFLISLLQAVGFHLPLTDRLIPNWYFQTRNENENNAKFFRR
jgi:hypothetical protein